MNNRCDLDSNNLPTENEYAKAVKRGQQWRAAFQRLLWWAAGKSSSLMQNCAESVRIKYSAIGIWLTFVVPTFGGFAMGALLSDLHFGTLACSVGRGFYALVLIALERMTLSFPNDPNKVKNWLRAIPRFLIVICASYLITETLITVAFNRQIKAEMSRKADIVVAQKGASLRQEQGARVQQLNAENDRLKARLDELFRIRLDAETAMHAEADGEGGTFRKGEGDNYKRRKEAFDRTAAEFQSEKPVIEDKIRANEAELSSLNAIVTQAQLEKQSIEDEADDLLARHEALMRLVMSRPMAALLYLACWIFLMMVDLICLLLKLVAPPDEYDDGLQFEAARRDLSTREEQKRAMLMISEKNVAQTAFDLRILKSAGKGQAEKLPELERSVGKRVHGEFIHAASNELTTRRPSIHAGPEFSDAVTLEIVGHPDLNAVLRLPRSEMNFIKTPQLQSKFDQIGKALSKHTGHIYELDRVENSLGLEIWRDSPLLAQLEPDRLVRLTFRSSLEDLGLKSDASFFASHPKWRSN